MIQIEVDVLVVGPFLFGAIIFIIFDKNKNENHDNLIIHFYDLADNKVIQLLYRQTEFKM